MIQYIKGPLGYAITKNGKPVGKISDFSHLNCWVLKLHGHSWPPAIGSVSEKMGLTSVPVKHCKTLQEAQDEAERLLQEPADA